MGQIYNEKVEFNAQILVDRALYIIEHYSDLVDAEELMHLLDNFMVAVDTESHDVDDLLSRLEDVVTDLNSEIDD